MKRVKLNIAAQNHNEAFEQGVKQLVRNKRSNDHHYPDYELNSIIRYEQETSNQAPRATPTFGLHIVDLLQELVRSDRRSHQQ